MTMYVCGNSLTECCNLFSLIVNITALKSICSMRNLVVYHFYNKGS